MDKVQEWLDKNDIEIQLIADVEGVSKEEMILEMLKRGKEEKMTDACSTINSDF